SFASLMKLALCFGVSSKRMATMSPYFVLIVITWSVFWAQATIIRETINKGNSLSVFLMGSFFWKANIEISGKRVRMEFVPLFSLRFRRHHSEGLRGRRPHLIHARLQVIR